MMTIMSEHHIIRPCLQGASMLSMCSPLSNIRVKHLLETIGTSLVDASILLACSSFIDPSTICLLHFTPSTAILRQLQE